VADNRNRKTTSRVRGSFFIDLGLLGIPGLGQEGLFSICPILSPCPILWKPLTPANPRRGSNTSIPVPCNLSGTSFVYYL
jgi:hypothetical protein